jgi:hypothetical protein
MPRPFLSILVLTVSLAGCAGTQKPAEAPESAETDTSSQLTSATADRPIQSAGQTAPAPGPPPGPPASAVAPAPAPAAGDSSLEAAVVRGDALPPPPPVATKGAKTAKVKKTGKKKTAKPQ